jgi:hypothetical protein
MKYMKKRIYIWNIARLLTHRRVSIYIIQYGSTLTYPLQSAESIIQDIWAKWDFDRNDTLPVNTIRFGGEHNQFRNTATGEVYTKE